MSLAGRSTERKGPRCNIFVEGEQVTIVACNVVRIVVQKLRAALVKDLDKLSAARRLVATVHLDRYGRRGSDRPLPAANPQG